MRSKSLVMVSAFALLFAATAFAASNPLEGTWKLNAVQSRFAPNDATAPKEETMVFRIVGDQFEITDTGTQKNGAAISGKYTTPLGGGIFRDSTGAEGETYVETKLDEHNRFLTQVIKGKQTQVQHLVLAKDGKTMSITKRSSDAKGKPFESVSVFVKQ